METLLPTLTEDMVVVMMNQWEKYSALLLSTMQVQGMTQF